MIATAVFSQPPIGTVGMTEAEARHAFGDVDVYRSVFRPMKVTFYHGEEQTLMKLLVNPADQKVVGVHVVGPDAPEMIQMAAIAVKMGVTKAQWDSTCAVHPTAAEELRDLLDDAVRAGFDRADLALITRLACGTTTTEMAAEMHVTDRTIRNHRTAALYRLRHVALCAE
jgi:hypothetical protein